MYNFQFPFLKLSGFGTWRDVSPPPKKAKKEVAKTNAVATKAFATLLFNFSTNIMNWNNIVRPPNSVPTACPAGHSLRLGEVHLPGEAVFHQIFNWKLKESQPK